MQAEHPGFPRFWMEGHSQLRMETVALKDIGSQRHIGSLAKSDRPSGI